MNVGVLCVGVMVRNGWLLVRPALPFPRSFPPYWRATNLLLLVVVLSRGARRREEIAGIVCHAGGVWTVRGITDGTTDRAQEVGGGRRGQELAHRHDDQPRVGAPRVGSQVERERVAEDGVWALLFVLGFPRAAIVDVVHRAAGGRSGRSVRSGRSAGSARRRSRCRNVRSQGGGGCGGSGSGSRSSLSRGSSEVRLRVLLGATATRAAVVSDVARPAALRHPRDR